MAQGNAERQASYRERQRSSTARINILVSKEAKQALDVLASIHNSQRKALETVLPSAAKAETINKKNDRVRELIGRESMRILEEFARFKNCSVHRALEIAIVDVFWPQFQAHLKRQMEY